MYSSLVYFLMFNSIPDVGKIVSHQTGKTVQMPKRLPERQWPPSRPRLAFKHPAASEAPNQPGQGAIF
eukprot:TRINITY_DN7565_c0_g1_i1.p3 TRINITY_DN7565_c0_g1~~TRINITY_DN7565_c0_g1_i1.p3  ORF type:complete len:68 (-),score=0.40 TRINITY_DN7565_c0_g1_i1:161-364(-)